MKSHSNGQSGRSGFCECGCGQKTKIETLHCPKVGRFVGEPRRFVNGHVRNNKTFKRKLGYVKDAKSGCWVWQGPKSKDGYYQIKVSRKRILVHRWMYEKEFGPIPNGLFLDHLCRNPKCVNPMHLEPVTHTENLRRGLSTKLTVDKVAEIKRISGDFTQTEIAKMFKVCPSNINKILCGVTWKDVQTQGGSHQTL